MIIITTPLKEQLQMHMTDLASIDSTVPMMIVMWKTKHESIRK